MEAVLNLLGIVKERFEVERVELEVVACLSGGNLASLIHTSSERTVI